jgi:CRP-like cAMP-binding protein
MTIADSVARLGQFRLFAGLSEADLTLIGQQFEEMTVPAGTPLFHQGEVSRSLYLVERGQIVEVERDSAKNVILHRVAEPGDLVGRRPALENIRHHTMAEALHNASVLFIDTESLWSLLRDLPTLHDRLRRTEVMGRLMAMPLFGDFDQAQLSQTVDLVQVLEYPAGQSIYSQDDPADYMYAIDTGQVVEAKDGAPSIARWIGYHAAGSFFGQEELRRGIPYQATALAETDVVLFRINRDGFDWLQRLRPSFAQALDPPPIAEWLAKTELFRRLTNLEREHLAGFVGLAHYAPGAAIFHQGDKDQTIYILYEGEAIVRWPNQKGQERPYDYAYPGQPHGQHALFLGEPHAWTIRAITPNNWLYMHRDDLDRFLATHPAARSKLAIKQAVQARQQLRRLKWMDPDELLLCRERRHWVVLLRNLIAPGMLLLLGVLALLFGGVSGGLLLLEAVALLLGLLWLAWNVLDWSNDYFIITSKRVAHRERLLFIRETREEAPLDKVQNVNIEQRFWGNTLGYGSVVIDTAATAGGGRVTFDYLGKPSSVKEMIFEEMSRVRASERQEVRREIRDTLTAGMGTVLQPRIPPIATAPFVAPAAPPAKREPHRQPPSLRRWWPVWMERRLPDRVIWRKHWIRLLYRVWISSMAIIAFLVTIILLLASGFVQPSGLLLAGVAVVLLPLLGWFWWGFVNWGNDQYIATDDRLIDVEKLPLGFRSQQTETTFDKVQNVSYTIPNILANLLNYGTVIIHTAGPEGRLTFDFVVGPRKVQAEIFRRLGAYNENKRRREREQLLAEMPDWFAGFADLTRSRS